MAKLLKSLGDWGASGDSAQGGPPEARRRAKVSKWPNLAKTCFPVSDLELCSPVDGVQPMVTKRGRKTAGELTAVPPLEPARPTPGGQLTAEEAEVFRGIVAAVTPDHFQESDLVLLTAY